MLLSQWSWWLLAPNTPRQDRRPCTHRKKFNFLLPFFVSTPVDQGVNRRFSPWTPSSLLAIPRCAAEKEQGVQRANHTVCPLPGRCRKRSKPEFEIPAQGAGPGWVLPRGVRSEKPPTPQIRETLFFHWNRSFATPSFVRPAFVSGNLTEVRQPGP